MTAAPVFSFADVSEVDAKSLAEIRVEAMRESLESVGRFDPARARSRFLSGFEPRYTTAILATGQCVGFFVVKPTAGGLFLDHLYVLPSHQSQGIGSAILKSLFVEADARHCEVTVGALRGSRSNEFYQRHGFVLVKQEAFDNYYVRRPSLALSAD